MGHHYIVETCIECGACAGTCPVKAVSVEGDHHHIDEQQCIDCGTCEQVCPVGAIKVRGARR